MGVRSEEQALRIDLNIWYPTLRQPRELQYQPWTISGALNAKPAEGRFPLLIISHDTPADRFAYHELAALLAREGFIVAAPTHSADWMNNMDSMFTWEQLTDRVRDIGAAIEIISGSADFSACMDTSRIGVIGFGSGATAALLAGGAIPDASAWPGYCARAGIKDAYCRSSSKKKLDEMCAALPLKNSLANPKIKAIAAIAPGYGMLFNAASFRYFYPPLLLVCAAKAKFNRTGLHCEPLARILGAKARFLEVPVADENAFMSPCPQNLVEELPELCLSVSSAERASIHKKLSESLLAFFGHYLKITANLPEIPQPPDSSPPAPPPGKASSSSRK